MKRKGGDRGLRPLNDMKKIDISKLNPEQRKAAIHKDGTLLILAGAGSGKTATMVQRIGYLISEHKVKPYNILAVTFTNKAAAEMKERAIDLVGPEGKDVTISTFHSFCSRKLRTELKDFEGYGSNFTIFDDSNSKSLIKDAMKEFNVDPEKLAPSLVLSWISGLKSELLEPKHLKIIASWLRDPVSKKLDLPPYIDQEKSISVVRCIPEYMWGILEQLYTEYQDNLKQNNALDFDDLINVMVRLLISNEELLYRYQEKYKYIMVDEYQDTNHAQYILIRLLAQKYQNLAVVGDDYQCIYGFRNADIRNILSFEKDYPNSLVIKLEQNYRSTQEILSIANELIAKNKNQRHKKLWSNKSNGISPKYNVFENVEEEADFIAKRIIEYKTFNPTSEIAVLYRVNAQSRAIEDALVNYGLPYRMVGGFSFYQRSEIKDICSYINFLLNESNSVDLLRIINVPKRGLGSTTLKKIEEYANKHEITVWEALNDSAKYLTGKNVLKINDFIETINNLKEAMEVYQVGELMEIILEDTGYRKALEEKKTEENIDKLENLDEFLNIAWNYQSQENSSVQGFMEKIALVQGETKENNQVQGGQRINLMTIHGSKGLEFSLVFVIGLEENMLPYSRAIAEKPEGVEEERRLAYVAITRAKTMLYLTRVKARRIFGRIECFPPSRFLVDIGFEEPQKPRLPW